MLFSIKIPEIFLFPVIMSFGHLTDRFFKLYFLRSLKTEIEEIMFSRNLFSILKVLNSLYRVKFRFLEGSSSQILLFLPLPLV